MFGEVRARSPPDVSSLVVIFWVVLGLVVSRNRDRELSFLSRRLGRDGIMTCLCHSTSDLSEEEGSDESSGEDHCKVKGCRGPLD